MPKPKSSRSPATDLNAQFYRRLHLLGSGDSYAELGAMTATPAETVRRYFVGMSKPHLAWGARLCREKGVSLDWLCFGTGRGPKAK